MSKYFEQERSAGPVAGDLGLIFQQYNTNWMLEEFEIRSLPIIFNSNLEIR